MGSCTITMGAIRKSELSCASVSPEALHQVTFRDKERKETCGKIYRFFYRR